MVVSGYWFLNSCFNFAFLVFLKFKIQIAPGVALPQGTMLMKNDRGQIVIVSNQHQSSQAAQISGQPTRVGILVILTVYLRMTRYLKKNRIKFIVL